MITKLLFLLVKGESFSSAEITEVFFGVTKLFQSDDVILRRMMYLFIKEVAETCNPDDVIIVTSSLTKDMNTGEDLYRANSMRVLAKIIDAAMLGAIERYLKQAIVDRNAFVASSALMSGLRLFVTCPEIVRRWINEVQEAGETWLWRGAIIPCQTKASDTPVLIASSNENRDLDAMSSNHQFSNECI